MRGRDPPFASLALGWRRAVRMSRRSETSAVFLKRSATLCGEIENLWYKINQKFCLNKTTQGKISELRNETNLL